MRWPEKKPRNPEYKEGDVRVQAGFLWLPLRCTDTNTGFKETRWLEHCRWTETLTRVRLKWPGATALSWEPRNWLLTDTDITGIKWVKRAVICTLFHWDFKVVRFWSNRTCTIRCNKCGHEWDSM